MSASGAIVRRAGARPECVTPPATQVLSATADSQSNAACAQNLLPRELWRVGVKLHKWVLHLS